MLDFLFELPKSIKFLLLFIAWFIIGAGLMAIPCFLSGWPIGWSSWISATLLTIVAPIHALALIAFGFMMANDDFWFVKVAFTTLSAWLIIAFFPFAWRFEIMLASAIVIIVAAITSALSKLD